MFGTMGAVAARFSLRGDRIANELWAASVLARLDILPIGRPRVLLANVAEARRFGQLGASTANASRQHGGRTGIVDERGALSFAELDKRVNRLANAWLARGLMAGDGVALLARNHRGLLEASFAAFKTGARLILLNTDFAGPQMREVADREGTRLLVHDEEWTDIVSGIEPPLGRLRAWADTPGSDTLDALIASGDPSSPPSPPIEAQLVVLTSGTTGLPKGAARPSPKTLVPIAGFFDKIPFRPAETTVIGIPMFHALGFAHAAVALNLGSTIVLRRRFDPGVTVDLVEQHRASALILVPTMLRRILDLGERELARHDLRSLRIVFVSGSQLGGELSQRATRVLGSVIYNLYGSTEVAAATIATPDELAAAPDTVGTPPRGITVQLYDEHDQPVTQAGITGRIFAGTGIEFEGYTGGGSKAMVDGLMATGDVGHFDQDGRLFIDGRDDDMIVSGGENLFPGEVEELLNAHPEIVESAVIGVPDEEFGARLRAFVVCREGSELDDDVVRAYVRENLARFKVPRDVIFIEELPRNPTGKVLKRELAGQL